MRELAFGRYDFEDGLPVNDIIWLVLKEENDRMLLLSKYVLDWDCFTGGRCCPWKHSKVHITLEELYQEAFTAEERNRILPVTVKTRNGSFGQSFRESEEYLFLLSCDEVDVLLPDTDVRVGSPTEYALKRGAFIPGGYPGCCWWLRDTGYSPMYNAEVLHNGQVDPDGEEHEEPSGVRPAMWLRK